MVAQGVAREGDRFRFDVSLLADVDADAAAREREWSRVYQHFTPRVRDFFARRVGAPYELDDLVTEIWRRVTLNIGSLSAAEAMWTWLTTIGVNLLRDARRTRGADARRAEHFRVYLTEPDDQETVLDRLASDPTDGLDRALFAQRLALLSESDRQLLWYHAVEERPHDEIAKLLGLASAAASRQRLRRIRQKVRGE